MRFFLFLSLLFASSAIADGHIQIGIACERGQPTGIAIMMTKPDVIVIPIAHLILFCEREMGKPI